MKKMILFCVVFFTGLSVFSSEAVQSTSVSYDVFSPEKPLKARLLGEPIEKEDCNYYVISISEDERAYASDVYVPAQVLSYDPYIFKYKGQNYIFVKDKGKELTIDDILGIDDSVENLCASLVALDKNNDNRITPDELMVSKIRLVKISSKGRLLNDKKSDFDLRRIDYIDLQEIKTIVNSSSTGINAHFFIYLKTKNERITGLVISADDKIMNNLF